MRFLKTLMFFLWYKFLEIGEFVLKLLGVGAGVLAVLMVIGRILISIFNFHNDTGGGIWIFSFLVGFICVIGIISALGMLGVLFILIGETCTWLANNWYKAKERASRK